MDAGPFGSCLVWHLRHPRMNRQQAARRSKRLPAGRSSHRPHDLGKRWRLVPALGLCKRTYPSYATRSDEPYNQISSAVFLGV